MRLKDKNIIVTGSATGIGKAMATRFVAEGARVVIHGLDRAAGEQVVAALGGGKAALLINDLAKPASAKELVEFAVGKYGTLHGLVNNAAYIPRTDLFTTDAAVF